MLKFVPLAACLAMTAVPALAADAEPKASSDTKMVCKRVDGTGFRLARQKVCKTQAEWNAESREARDEIDRNSRRDVD
jgi:hypothetical protein